MKFKENDTVKIMKNYKGVVKKGEIGTILMVFGRPQEAYEVEILDEKGKQKVQCTLLPDDLELVIIKES